MEELSAVATINPRWTPEEDKILLEFEARHGTKQWMLLQESGLLPTRTNKACCSRFRLLKALQEQEASGRPPINSPAGGEPGDSVVGDEPAHSAKAATWATNVGPTSGAVVRTISPSSTYAEILALLDLDESEIDAPHPDEHVLLPVDASPSGAPNGPLSLPKASLISKAASLGSKHAPTPGHVATLPHAVSLGEMQDCTGSRWLAPRSWAVEDRQGPAEAGLLPAARKLNADCTSGKSSGGKEPWNGGPTSWAQAHSLSRLSGSSLAPMGKVLTTVARSAATTVDLVACALNTTSVTEPGQGSGAYLRRGPGGVGISDHCKADTRLSPMVAAASQLRSAQRRRWHLGMEQNSSGLLAPRNLSEARLMWNGRQRKRPLEYCAELETTDRQPSEWFSAASTTLKGIEEEIRQSCERRTAKTLRTVTKGAAMHSMKVPEMGFDEGGSWIRHLFTNWKPSCTNTC